MRRLGELDVRELRLREKAFATKLVAKGEFKNDRVRCEGQGP
jgi:hypothetical protein